MDQTLTHIKDFDRLLGFCLESLFLEKESYYKIKCSNKDGPWAFASSIPRSFLNLYKEKINTVFLSFSEEYQVSLKCISDKIIITYCDREAMVERESLDFTYESDIPVYGFEVSKINAHLCYGDYLINIKKIVNGNGALGYSFHFSSQDSIYITSIETDYLLIENIKPNGYNYLKT